MVFLLLNFFSLARVLGERGLLEKGTETDNVFIKFAGVDHPFVVFAIDMIPVVGKALVTELAVLVVGGLVLKVLN